MKEKVKEDNFFKRTVKLHPEFFKEWCEGKLHLGYHDFRHLASIKTIITWCKELYGLKIDSSEIEELCQLNLLECFKTIDLERRLPVYTPERIDFIRKVQSQFDYSSSRLQQIIRHETWLILENTDLKSINESSEEKLDNLKWYINVTKFNVRANKLFLNKLLTDHKDSAGEAGFKMTIKEIESNIAHGEKMIAYLSNKKLEDLPEPMKEALFGLQFYRGSMKFYAIIGYRNQILQGYSPQVEFKGRSDPLGDDKKNLTFEGIDWEHTFKNIKGDDDIDFFRTPLFSLEVTGEKVIIKILDYQKADAGVMYIISNIYKIFRRRPAAKKKKWGEVSGRRLGIIQRDAAIKRLYPQLQKEKPTVASRQLLDYLLEYSKKIGFPVRSYERIKRIIYSKKQVMTF